LPAQIQIVIRRDGQQQVFVISMLEDLEEDTRYYLGVASGLKVTGADLLTYKRACRSALLSFYAYAEGALNLVLLALAPTIAKKAPKNFFDKLQLIEDTLGATGARRLGHAIGITRLRRLRNAIEHWKPGADLELFKGLESTEIERLTLRFKRWVRTLPKRVQIVLRPTSRGIHRALRESLRRKGVETTLLQESTHVSRRGREG
jgi:hypothetical protein